MAWWNRRREQTAPIPNVEHKLACVVDASLKMGKGKIAAQVGHLCMEVALGLERNRPRLLQAWTSRGQAKVVLKALDSEEMHLLIDRAKEANLLTWSVRDAGRTQIPSGSMTVIGIGPAPVEQVDDVTSYLKLL